MFRRFRILLSVLVFVLLIGQVNVKAADIKNVKDYLNYLKSSEASDLQNEIDNVKSELSLDAVIVITDKTDGKSSKDYADDYYDQNGYGVGSDKSGILMLINMDKREIWISTTGKAIDIYTDSRISDMVDHVKGMLTGKDYNGACKKFIEDVKTYAKQGVPKDQIRVDTETGQRGTAGQSSRVYVSRSPKKSYIGRAFGLMKSFPVYIIALIISIIAVVIVSVSSKGRNTINSQTYEEQGSFELSDTRDDFIRETTTTRKIETSSNNNTSSTSSSSSGTTHGGGGGTF